MGTWHSESSVEDGLARLEGEGAATGDDEPSEEDKLLLEALEKKRKSSLFYRIWSWRYGSGGGGDQTAATDQRSTD